jgi:hypothetical protein
LLGTEELELVKQPGKLFVKFDFDLSPIGVGKAKRNYYLIQIDEDDLVKIVLDEGKEAKLVNHHQIALINSVTPYDSFALRLFVEQI